MEAKEIIRIAETYWHPDISESELRVIAEIAFKAGRREVVEWIKQNCYMETTNADDTGDMIRIIREEEWQAQEWGIA